MSKTIEQIKKDILEIEVDFMKKLTNFEKNSEINIKRVEVFIDSYSYDEEEIIRRNPERKKRELKGVLDVNIIVNIGDDTRSID